MSSLPIFLSRKQEEYVEQNREAVAQLNDEVLGSIEGIRVMRAYSRRDQQVKQFQKKTASLSKTGDKIASIQYSFGPLALLFIGFSTVLLLLFGGQSPSKRAIESWEIIGFTAVFGLLIEPMWMMADLILVYQTGQMSYKKLKEVIDETDDLEPDGSHYLEEIDLVQFKDYSFSYPGAERKSLSGIDWTIQKGQTVGIVGRTGAGKTTLVRQFLRQYPVGEGEFLVNQQPIVDYNRHSIEEKIGYVSQEHILFSKSIRENIALGKKGASQEDLVEANSPSCFLRMISSGCLMEWTP